MANANQKLNNSFVSMTANLQRLAEDERLTVLGVLKNLETELTSQLQNNPDLSEYKKSRFNAQIKQCQETIKENYTNINNQHQVFLSNTAGVTAAGSAKAINDIGLSINSVITTPEQYKALASRALIDGAPSSAWWSRQSLDLQNKFADQMRIGYVNGESVDDLVRRVRGRYAGKQTVIIDGEKTRVNKYEGGIMDVSTREATALVRTSIQQVSSDAKRDFFHQNKDLIKGIVQVSTLDLRTTLQCAGRDGLMWDLEGNPIDHSVDYDGGVPLHWNCRSTEVPVTKSWEELIAEAGGSAGSGIDKEYLEGITPTTRASLNGQVPQSMTFDQWFGDLPENDQKAYLGPRKYEIWKDAGLTFAEMTDKAGNPLSILQLAETYGFELHQARELNIPNIPRQTFNALVVEQEAQKIASDIASQTINKTLQTFVGSLPYENGIVAIAGVDYDLLDPDQVLAFTNKRTELIGRYINLYARGDDITSDILDVVNDLPASTKKIVKAQATVARTAYNKLK